jgi:hypothetical protein
VKIKFINLKLKIENSRKIGPILEMGNVAGSRFELRLDSQGETNALSPMTHPVNPFDMWPS